MFGTKSNQALRVLSNRACFSSKLTLKNTDPELGKSQIKMRQLSSQRERFIAPFESLVRIAELPQSLGRGYPAIYPGIIPTIAGSERPVTLRIIKGDRHFKLLP